MKIDKNNTTYPISRENTLTLRDGSASFSARGIPLRLEIASRLLAGMIVRQPLFDVNLYDALVLADKLIEVHNKSCEEK